MTNESKTKLETLELYMRCRSAMNTLRAHKKLLDKEHAERIKRIAAAAESIEGQRAKGDLDLPGFGGVSLPDELVALITNPTRGL